MGLPTVILSPTRRSFIKGAAALIAAPAIIRPSEAYWQSRSQQSVVSAGNPITFIAGSTAGSGDGTNATSAAINTTGANLLIAAVSTNQAVPLSTPVTDNKGNTWNALTAYTDSILPRIQLFWSSPTSVGSGHTATYNISGSEPSIGFAAFSNANATPFDNEVGTSGSSVSPAGGSITPAANNSLIIAATSFFIASTGSVDSGYTIIDTVIARVAGSHFGLGVAYLLQGSAAASNPTWTIDSSTFWAATNAAFKS